MRKRNYPVSRVDHGLCTPLRPLSVVLCPTMFSAGAEDSLSSHRVRTLVERFSTLRMRRRMNRIITATQIRLLCTPDEPEWSALQCLYPQRIDEAGRLQKVFRLTTGFRKVADRKCGNYICWTRRGWPFSLTVPLTDSIQRSCLPVMYMQNKSDLKVFTYH